MNILILNWRDIKNPSSGGAEVLTHEIAKRWVKLGHQVTLFSSVFSNSKKEEIIDGVKFVRQGYADARFLFFSVHFLAYKFYKKNPGKFDVILDEIHGLPFFTPWYVKERKIVLICEIAGDLWKTMFGSIFGLLGRLAERYYLRYIYKNISYLTISDSTKEELIKEGVDSKKIIVLPMGATVPEKINKTVKESQPTIIFVGRIAKSKGIEDAITMLNKVSSEHGKVRLWIVGAGPAEYVDYLKEMTKKLKIYDKITFFGFVSEEKKFELMSKANVLVVPSVKEGWGLIVPEAAYVGTPSVVYDSPGLRDVLKGNNYKIIVKENTPDALAKEVMKVLKQKNGKYKKLDEKYYDWGKTAEAALRAVIQ